MEEEEDSCEGRLSRKLLIVNSDARCLRHDAFDLCACGAVCACIGDGVVEGGGGGGG